jgi:hypothetical protein
VVDAPELSGVLDRHYLFDVLDYANRRTVALRVGTDGTDVLIAYIMAYLAVFHIPPKRHQSGSKAFRISGIPAEHVQSQTERSLPPYARQGRQLVHRIFQ